MTWVLAKLRAREERIPLSIEGVIVSVLVLLFVAGSVEYGWMYHRIHQLTECAEAGVLVAVATSHSTEEAVAAVDSAAERLRLSGLRTEVRPGDLASVVAGQLITVTVEAPYEGLSLITLGIFPTPETVRASATAARQKTF